MFLNNHSTFSLRYGTIPEIELLALAQKNSLTHFPITDINNTSACLNFIRKAPEFNISPIAGIDFRNNVQQCYVCLAKNNEGFLELNNFLSQHLHHNTEFPDIAPALDNSVVIYPFEVLLTLDKSSFRHNEYIGISLNDINKLRFSKLSEQTEKLVVLHTVSFRDKRDFNVHRLLRAMDTNTLLSKLPESEQGSFDHQILPTPLLKSHFRDYPHIIQNTQKLLESCQIHFDFSKNRKNQNLQTLLSSKKADFEKLQSLCKKGLSERYTTIDDNIKKRLKKELTLIRQQDFVSFFLINWRIIQYAKSKDYYHVGRGSGANSIVAYLLGITDVDPIDLDLYFERFMNLYRANPPDFDIDFSTWDREDITRFIFEEFGKKKTNRLTWLLCNV